MSSLAKLAFRAIVMTIAVAMATGAAARVADSPEGRSSVPPAPLLPVVGARVPESTGRLEVAPGVGVSDVRVVISPYRFDPSSWSSLPTGPAWTIVPLKGRSVALGSLGLAGPVESTIWWTVVWKDSRTGSFHAGEVRDLSLVPRFANRVGPDGRLRNSASGKLQESPAASADASRPGIELATGYVLGPDVPLPRLPEALKGVKGAATTGMSRRDAYIVQFADGSPDSARARIARAGGELISAISGDGYLVRIEPGALPALEAATGRPWVAPYEPAYKLSPALNDSATGPIDAMALLFDDADEAATIAALRALGAARVISQSSSQNRLVRFELDRARLADAAALSDVAWIEPTPVFMPSNDKAQWVIQSGVENDRPVWAHGLRGQGQVVMISDSGLRTNHEMFNDSTLAINGWGDYPNHRKVIAYQPGSDDVVFGDDVGFDYHGTHTSGSIAGNPDATSGAPWSGMAKDARLYFVDLAGTGGGAFNLPPDLNQLFQPSYTGNAGGAARISSNSWGAASSLGAYTITSMTTDQFVWNHPDYLIAFASGNIGVFASVSAPGTAKNVLTVGATGNGTLQNTLASFSSRGPAKDGRRKPTVVAPGDLVTSSIGSTRYTYATYSGTSMATPVVAGAMALVRQYLTEGWYPSGAPVPANGFQPSAALLRAMAVAAARNDVISFRAPDNSIGYGRLTIDDVLYFPGDSLRTLLVDTEDGLSDRQFVEYQVQVTDPGQPLKIALCWTDAPGNPASAVQLVNDLDLLVTHNGLTYRGNYLLNNVSVVGGVRDSLNVEEFVRLAAPGPGLWTIRVEGRRVVLGPQRFALCVTGGVGGSSGTVALDRFEYGLTDTLEVEVIDTHATGPLTVFVSSGTETWGENLTLTGSNGVYRGALPIAPIPPLLSDHVLAVTSGDLVTVRYVDSADGVPVEASSRVNTLAPTISDVHATALGGTHALVTWTTDIGASSRVHLRTPEGAMAVVDSAGSTLQHSVLLTGLSPATTYTYDVESVTALGDASLDSLGGAHRALTTHRRGSLAVLMDDPSASVLETWQNALGALGWEADYLPALVNDPPLIGNSSAGLRSYDAVLWQVDPNRYPPFTDAQRMAIDSLLNGGGRLLVTGHDIGFGLSDAGAPSYTPEREAWIESGLKTRYYADNIWADTLIGVAGNPVSGAFADSLTYAYWLYPDSGDNMGAAPGTDGVWTGDWIENFLKARYIGMHWESNTPRGTNGEGVWGGHTSRLVGQFFEWRALVNGSTAHTPDRTAVLRDAACWLMEHRPPEVHIVTPTAGTVVTEDFVAIRYSVLPDSGRTITSRLLDFSLDGGESWAPVTTSACTDSGCIWDLAAALGGAPTPNSTRVLLRVRVADDGAPSLQSTAHMAGTFTLARAGGDNRGPVVVAGSASCNPAPIRVGQPATLFAIFSDAETGGSTVSAAEYSIGTSPAPAGSATPMTGTFGTASVQTSAALPTESVPTGSMKFWVRGRDAAGNWGPAAALTVPSSGPGSVGVEDALAVDFLATPAPNPFHGSATIRFGLARAGEARLEVFDVTGRRVRTIANGTLPPGTHVSVWNGRDEHGNGVRAGVYFVRLTLPSKTFHARMVALQ